MVQVLERNLPNVRNGFTEENKSCRQAVSPVSFLVTDSVLIIERIKSCDLNVCDDSIIMSDLIIITFAGL